MSRRVILSAHTPPQGPKPPRPRPVAPAKPEKLISMYLCHVSHAHRQRITGMAAVTVYVGVPILSQPAVEFKAKVYVGQFGVSVANKCRYHIPHVVTIPWTCLRKSGVIEPGCITIPDRAGDYNMDIAMCFGCPFQEI